MRTRAADGNTGQVELSRPRDRGLARALTLLETSQAGGLTVAALRDHGIEAPALTVYELQLAGHEIERVPHEDGTDTDAGRTGCAP